MPVVRGDRIGLSGKLSRCSTDAQTAYAHLVAAVPDDFGRFPVRWLPIMARLYPNLDDARRIGRVVTKWKARFAEYEREGLIRTWVVDGVTYAEFSGFVSTGNHWHRTPEPDWSSHRHGKRCLRTAIHSARASKQVEVADGLSIQLKELTTTGPERSPNGARTGGGTPSPPSPPSPPFQITTDNGTPLPPASGGGVENRQATGNGNGHRPGSRAVRADHAERLLRLWIGLTPEALRQGIPLDARDRITKALREGRPYWQVANTISEMVRDSLVGAGELDPTDHWPPEGWLNLADEDAPAAVAVAES